ncbi:alpha-L-glutamate ligase-like protein [Alkalispirillum mobile]|uniref:Alpha-L-glutamate ligase-like protein n=1 Tax=Alkalispirillum mobile TaxID=85925 RepID=A0A498C6F6_9GAMM|nr:alpha-L-glutamate ligase-like protein [Alkalispirillum mobile]RLK50943.1 alpha-L-glutamate ligase-like protein [Alkalispirillum mobile]
MRLFGWARQLREQGIVGLNERNLSLINLHNPRERFPLVDDKLQTKLLARKYGIDSPELLGVIHSQGEIRKLESLLRPGQGFAIKPSRGSGGKGILVILEHKDGWFRKGSGVWVSRRDVVRYLSNLLSGLYTLGGSPDVAVIEALIEFDAQFETFTFEGVPDIRVVVYRGYPLMAMMRLSTHASDGKANLHQGAIGVGLDIATGKANRAVQYDRPVTVHPDTGRNLHELAIPDWTRLLELASGCYEMSGLGYLGTDMVLDRNRGPLLLELNARPGLAIQMANGCGLAPRVARIDKQERERIRKQDDELYPAAERVAFAQRAFAAPQKT